MDNTATAITELRSLLAQSKAGDVLKIDGYVGSDGRTSDLVVMMLEASDYRKMQEEARRILLGNSADSPEEGAAAQAILKSLEESLFGEKTTAFKDIYRDAGGFHVHKDSGTLEEVFLLRLAVISNSNPEPMPKSEVALRKRLVAEKLSLPTARYKHALKFVDGSFEKVTKLDRAEYADVPFVLGLKK